MGGSYPKGSSCAGKTLTCASMRKGVSLFFRPAASHSVRVCSCPPDCRTNVQTAWLAKAVHARGPSKSGACHARALLRCLPCLAVSLLGVQRVMSCLSVRHPLFCLGTAGCGPLTAALTAFASAGVKGRHSPTLESVSGRCTGYRRRG